MYLLWSGLTVRFVDQQSGLTVEQSRRLKIIYGAVQTGGTSLNMGFVGAQVQIWDGH